MAPAVRIWTMERRQVAGNLPIPFDSERMWPGTPNAVARFDDRPVTAVAKVA